MICHKDGTQMQQLFIKNKAVGHGVSKDNYYETEEVKVCPKCKTLVLETYIAMGIDKKYLKDYLIVRGKKRGGEK